MNESCGKRAYSALSSTQGFTLIEVIVAIGITSFISLLVFVCMKMGFDACGSNGERIRMQQFAQITIQKIVSGLNKAETIAIDPDGCGLAFSSEDKGYYYYFDESSRQIKRQLIIEGYDTKASALHTSEIQVLGCTFSDHGDCIQISITLQTRKNASNGRPEYHITTDIPVPNRQR